MKLKLWQFEYSFDKEDAKIAVPIILYLFASNVYDQKIILPFISFYYFTYFFGPQMILKMSGLYEDNKMKCPQCRSKKIILRGYNTYRSDEHHAFYLCTNCKTTALLTNGGLTAI
jgi:hypothetical protein